MGTISEIRTDTFHISGRWAPADSPNLEAFLSCFESDDEGVCIGLGDDRPTMQARAYEKPDDYFDVNIVPSGGEFSDEPLVAE